MTPNGFYSYLWFDCNSIRPGGSEEAGHDAVLLGPRVDDGVDQVVAGPLLRDRGASAKGIESFLFIPYGFHYK